MDETQRTGSPFDSLHQQIELERKEANPEADLVKKFRDYARGRQPGTIEAGQMKILRGLLGNLFCDNICKRIIQEVRNRLQLIRFDVDGESVRVYLDQLWVLNRIDALQSTTHFAMLRDGNHAVALSWSNQARRVILHRENWWNGATGCWIAYDRNGQPTYAVKDWSERLGQTLFKFRTVWYADHIERYRQEGDGWRAYRHRTDPSDGSIHWQTRSGDPLGIPIVHFANIQLPNDGAGESLISTSTTALDHDVATSLNNEPDPHYGMSELDGGLLGLQDEINDIHRDVSASARFLGYQIIYITGSQRQRDPITGAPIPMTIEPGTVIEEPNPEAHLGTITPGSLSELKTALEIKLDAVGRMTGVSSALITGNWPSGEALLRYEMPLIDKVHTIGGAAGPAWSSVAHKATRMQNTFGGAALDEDDLITSVFAPPERRDPITLASIATARAPHISERETLRLYGYSVKDADRIMKEREEDAERALKQATAAAAAVAPKPADTGPSTASTGGT